MPYKDPVVQATNSRQRYLDNRENYLAIARRSSKKCRALVSQFIWDYLMEHPCVDCGNSDPVVLEFDHVRGQKEFGVGGHGNRSMRVVKEEIAKCEVRCANCHKIRHWEKRNST